MKAAKTLSVKTKEIVSFKYDKLYDEREHTFREKDIIKMTKEITDEYGNIYVCLPPLYINLSDEARIINLSFSPSSFKSCVELKPQMISKYKSSLINGQCRSVPGVTPNFNGIPYFASKNLIESVGGEMMNWKTQLYIQLIYLAVFRKEQDALDRFPGEDYDLNDKWGCIFKDTGEGEGEFLGIEQLFTSGYTFISFDDFTSSFINDICRLEFYYKIINGTLRIRNFSGKAKAPEYGNQLDFGLWGLLGIDCFRDDYKDVLSTRGKDTYKNYFEFPGDSSARLCKAPQKKGGE